MRDYYKGLKDGQEVLIYIEQDQDMDSPLDWSSAVYDHRPLFILTNHTRYSLGDKDAENIAWALLQKCPEWQDSWLEEDEYIWIDGSRDEGGYWKSNPNYLGEGLNAIIEAASRCRAFIKPVYMYDHSGISLSLDNTMYPFNDKWDSGCIGIILWTRQQQDTYGMAEKSDSERSKHADQIISNFFDTYNKYVQGEVYYMAVVDVREEINYLEDRQDLEHGHYSLEDLYLYDIEFCADRGTIIESCGGFYFSDEYTPVIAANEYWGITDMVELFI